MRCLACFVTLVAASISLLACGGSSSTDPGSGGAGLSSSDGGSASHAGGGGSSEAGGGGSGAGGGANECAYPPSILEEFEPKRTLFVAPTGDDQNDGSSAAKAWKTLAHSAAIRPGDEIRIAPGTYPCPLLGPVAGTKAAPVHFVAAGAPRSAVLDCGGTGGILMTNLQYVAFEGLEITNGTSGHCVNLNSGGGPPYANLSEHVLFLNDYIHACGMSALKVSQAFEIEVRKSELADNRVAGNPLIDTVGVHAVRVLESDIHDSINIGVQVKGGAYDCLVEGNRIHDVADHAIQLGEATGQPYFLPDYTDWEAQDSVAANNLLFGKMRAAVGVQGCNRCVVAHNTVWATAPAFFVRGLSTTNGTGAAIDTQGLVLKDNIFAATTVPIPLNITAANAVGLDQGYNLYFSTAGNIAGAYSDTPIGGMGNLVDVDPKFVNATTPDLHLAKDSKAIGAATPVKGVTRDFGGGCRRGDDLGAY